MDINYYPFSRQLGWILKEKNMKLVVAESCTGGGLCSAITRIPGSSSWFDCGFVVYSNNSKEEILGIEPQLIQEEGSVSEAIAREMAARALKRSRADISMSITGTMGPTSEKSIGTVWFGIAKKMGTIQCRKARFSSGRKHIQDSSVIYGLKYLIQSIID
ncbi:CinA family protein [Coxiella endosymbiont of Amblyomma sculptum]|uniref:CinA family protein n=1 Tax=Coxiella endosymbiont of Amblyomma sculptum TaxID=2487929 RepID=UPI00132E7967|nr:CinA family protein [Coxiella endosymbiont of Amblyomma sculptum]QHG92726.1 CinA family protein [Coxiella endosymbiont of Amblyomma sculptum]